MRGTPWGRHSADESSFSWMPVFRSSSSAWAHGWYGMLSTCRFAAKFAGLPSYVFSGLQIPVRSGLPFGDHGQVIGGDERFTFSVQLQPLQRKDRIKVDVVQMQKRQHAWIRSRPLQVMTDIRPLQM